jgi:hypothetical protein
VNVYALVVVEIWSGHVVLVETNDDMEIEIGSGVFSQVILI